MIIGVGNDITDIRRIENSLERFGERFINRIFSSTEQQKANRRKGNIRAYVSTYAKRFAAKEAFMKAMGTGYADGVYFKDISVVNDSHGKPDIELSGGALEAFRRVTGGKEAKLHLSMSDEYPYAFAVVIVETL